MARRTGALPEDFPHRDKLAGTIDTYEQLDAASDDDLRAIEGVGKAAVGQIRAAGADEDAKIEAGAVEVAYARVNRNKYFRHGQEYARGDVLRVPRYVLDDLAERGEQPPHLIEISEAEYEEARG